MGNSGWQTYGHDFVDIYDDLFVTKTQELSCLRWIIDEYGSYNTEFETVLDLGCGNGRLASWFMDEGYQYTALDVSSEMIRVISERYSKHALFKKADVANICHDYLPNEIFDLVVVWGLTLSMLDIDQQRMVISQACNHLSPGGLLIVQVARKDLFDLCGLDNSMFSFSRRRGGNIEARGYAEDRWWHMDYKWESEGLIKTTRDRILLSSIEDYKQIATATNLQCISLSDCGVVKAKTFGASDVLVFRKR